MRDVWHVSSTLPLSKVLTVKTIKQYVAMCQKILKKRQVRKQRRIGLNEDLIDVVENNWISFEEPNRATSSLASDDGNQLSQNDGFTHLSTLEI